MIRIPLIEAQPLTTSFSTYYTCDGAATIIDSLTLNNTSGIEVSVYVALVPLGSAANTSNTVLNVTVPAGQAYLCSEIVGQILASGGFISCRAATAGVVVARASGRKE